MNIDISKTLNILNLLSPVIPDKVIIPAYGYVLIREEKESCKIYASNNEMTVSGFMSAEGEPDCEMCISEYLLTNTLKTLKDQEASLEVKTMKNGSMHAILKAGKGKYKIDAIKPSEFIMMPQDEYKNEMTCSCENMINAMSRANSVVTVSELRPTLSGVGIKITENKLEICGANPHISNKQIMDISEGVIDLMISRSLCAIVSGMQGKGNMTIKSNSRRVFIKFGAIEIIAVLPMDKFAKIDAFFSKCPKDYISINRIDFLDSLKRLSLYSDIEDSTLYMEIEKEDSVTLRSFNEAKNSKAEEEIEISKNGIDKIKINFSIKFLKKAVSILESEIIDIHLDDNGVACFIKENSNQGAIKQVWMIARVIK